MTITRRAAVSGALALAAAGCVPLDRSATGRLAAKLRLIEAGVGGRLGVAFFDSGNRLTLGWRQDERFAMCSTFKLSLAALVLLLDQRGEIDADAVIRWQPADMLNYAPFAKERLGTGATLRELARAAQVLSDNTAANLLLARIGGPARLTAFWRAIGDRISRLDRTEPQLNFVPPGDQRDTTTPAAIIGTVAAILGPTVLGDAQREELKGWLRATATGAAKVRAGLPSDWDAGDKTGNSGDWPGMGYTRADIGFVTGPANDTISFAVYHQAPLVRPPSAQAVDAAFAETGRTLAAWISDNYRIVPG